MEPVASSFDLESQRLELWQNICCDIKSESLASVRADFNKIFQLESYWAYPGRETLFQLQKYLDADNIEAFRLLSANVSESLQYKTYRAKEFIPFYTNLNNLDKPRSDLLASHYTTHEKRKNLKPYFEVLIIHPDPDEYELLYRNSLANFKTSQDDYLFDVLFVDNYYDAIIAILSNSDIQACIYLDVVKDYKRQTSFLFLSLLSLPFFQGVVENDNDLTISLKKHITHLRPEIDHYYMSEGFASEQQQATFDRIIYAQSTNLFCRYSRAYFKRYRTTLFNAVF